MVSRADNRKAAEMFYDLALAMEIQGERWRANSYLRAAKSIEALGEHLRSISERKELRNIEGVGESIEAKLDEYLATGKIEALESVRDVLPEDLALFRDAPTLGTRRVADLDNLLGVRSVDDLLRALREGKVAELPDFGEEVERRTMEWLIWKREEAAEVPTPNALMSARRIIDFLKANDNSISRIELAGPARRRTTTVANVSLLFTSDTPDLVISRFGLCPEVTELTVVERDQAVGKTASGAGCMIRAVKEDAFAVEMLRTTGSDAFFKDLSDRAKERGKRLTPAGLGKGARTEEDIFAGLGLEPVVPEMREGRPSREEPPLRGEDLRGDLHVRSTSLDGALRVSEMARTAKDMGHSYICFADRIGGRRMDLDTLERRNALIDEVQGLIGLPILKGAEVDITPDGRLDAPADMLDGLDLVIGSVSTRLNMPAEELQARVLRALDEPDLDVLGHPTNRVIGLRERSPIDLAKVAERAAERKVALEMNTYPDRLDLSDDDAYSIYGSGAYYSLGTDAAFPNELGAWGWAVTMARKALVPPTRVLNSFPAEKLRNREWRK
jgi:DNA polymerase (family 10)